MPGQKVVVAGHLCLDFTPAFPRECGLSLKELMVPGRLFQVGAADVSPGGVVANTGLLMRKLGADVRLVGKIGGDALGGLVFRALAEHGPVEGMLIDPASDTSYTVVVAVPGEDRVFLHHPGANDTFVSDTIPDIALDGAALFHFGYPPLMRGMYEDGGAELVRLLRRVKARGIVTSLDMAAVDPASGAGKAPWERIVRDALPHTDIFVPSAEEIFFMLDQERLAEWKRLAGDGDVVEAPPVPDDAARLSEQLLEMGAKIVLIKCGARGIHYRTAPAADLAGIGGALGVELAGWGGKSGFVRSFRPEAVVSATGAGDASVAAFLTALLGGHPLEESARLAAAAGACCVSAPDARSGVPALAELERKIAGGWEQRGD